MSQGKLFVISGASGVGKSTVLSRVMARREDLRFSVSATTRAPRPGEVDGESYYVVTKEKFQEMIANDEFLEYDAHMANYYGTPEGQLNEKLETVGKVRGRKAALELLLKKFDENATDRDTVFMVHGDAPEETAMLEKKLREQYGVKTVIANYLGGVIGSHTGPGVIALFYMGNHR